MSRLYLVCATPRSGSSLLCTGLEATGLLGTSVEYFSRAAVHHNAVAWGMSGTGSTPSDPKVLTPEAYLDRVRRETFRPGRGGTKIHLYQLQLARALRIVDGLRDIFPAAPGEHELLRTRRRDVIGQAVSGHVADATRVYCHWVGKQPAISPGYENAMVLRPEYDFAAIAARCLEIVEHESAWDAEIAASGLPCETLWYEELATDYEATMRRAMNTVGLAPDVPVPAAQLMRQADTRNEEFVQRFQRDARAEGLNIEAFA